jgi:1-acyl-sn-glycerol-3-phosphate acyltransferase
MMNELRALAKAVYAYTLLAFGALLLAVICAAWGAASMLLLPVLTPAAGRRIGRAGATWGFRIFLAALEAAGAWRLDLRALDALKDAGPLIIAPNHPGLLDAVLLVSRLPNAVCVMKASLLHNFLLGPAARLARYVRNDSLFRLVTRSGEELRQGGQLLVFPEGTRSVSDPVGPFTEAVGAISRRTGVAVQTVIIEADSKFLGKGWRLLTPPEFPLHFKVRLGPRFEAPKHVRALTAEMERYFMRELSGRASAVSVSESAARPPVESAQQIRG